MSLSKRYDASLYMPSRMMKAIELTHLQCMSNGLKNIQSHARAYSRRDRLESGQSLASYDDDSGISGIGLTPVDDMEEAYDSPESGSSGVNQSLGSGSSTASQPQHSTYSTSMHSQNSYQGYGYSQPTAPHHGYTSSVSSSSTYGGQGQGHPSPYMGHGNRMPSVDMGIDAIINRGPGGNGQPHGLS